MDYWLPIIVLFGAFFFMLALGVPIVYAIGLSTLASISTQLDFNSALSVVSQKLASGLDSFTLLAIPFFRRCCSNQGTIPQFGDLIS